MRTVNTLYMIHSDHLVFWEPRYFGSPFADVTDTSLRSLPRRVLGRKLASSKENQDRSFSLEEKSGLFGKSQLSEGGDAIENGRVLIENTLRFPLSADVETSTYFGLVKRYDSRTVDLPFSSRQLRFRAR